MYSFQTGQRAPGALLARGRRAAVPRVVWWVGLSSLLADVSAESVTTALPIFLFTFLGLSPGQLGVLDGLYQGGASVAGIVAGYLADRRGSNRMVALLGYALSALSRIGLLLGAGTGLLAPLASLCVDRVGKGIRTAPRDTIIAGHTAPEALGAAFGVHRSMDAAGALLGPLVGGCVLWLMPDRYDLLFGISFVFGVAGVLVFHARVPEPARPSSDAPNSSAGAATAQGPLQAGAMATLLASNKAFSGLLFLVICVSLFTISDGLVYLFLQHEAGIAVKYMPFMFVLTSTVFIVAAAPMGRLADRIGRIATFIAGYGVLALVYVWLAFGPRMGSVGAIVIVAAMGLFYAATDGVLSATATRMLDPRVRTSGLALMTLAVGVTRIGSSSVYGWLWQGAELHRAMSVFAIGLTACCVLAALVFRATRRNISDAGAAR